MPEAKPGGNPSAPRQIRRSAQGEQPEESPAPQEKVFFSFGSASGFFSVCAGAFGAHALKAKLSQEMLAVFETGVRYQLAHALVLLILPWALSRFHPVLVRRAGWFFMAGSVIFSGSLYLLVLTGVRIWGAVTPAGGLMLLAGWFLLFLSSLRSR